MLVALWKPNETVMYHGSQCPRCVATDIGAFWQLRLSSKGTELLFQVIKAIMNQYSAVLLFIAEVGTPFPQYIYAYTCVHM